MQTILTFVDFSDVTPAVLKAAVEIARAFQMKLLLLHVSTPDADVEGQEIRTDVSREGVASQMHRLHRELQILSLECSKLGVDAMALLVRGTSSRGNPVPKMIREVGRIRPALVVMGTYGHGRIHEALLGSASGAVVHKAVCPILLIPSRATSPVWPSRFDDHSGMRTRRPIQKPSVPSGRRKKSR